jgi:hypothetical protein
VQVSALDAPVAVVGAPDALPRIKGPADLESGFSYCLFNNAWGTNYVMWTPYDGFVGRDVKSRYAAKIQSAVSMIPSRTACLRAMTGQLTSGH